MTSSAQRPPQAPRRPHEHTEHGVTRPDPYHWLRHLDDPEVVSHLVAERAWYDAATGHLTSLVETLRSEMVDRTPTADSSVRWRYGNFSYYTRLPAGREHAQLMRDLNTSPGANLPDPVPRGLADHGSEGQGQLLLDADLLAGDDGYVELGLTSVSPDGRLLAYSFDLLGDEVYRLRFRDLGTGEDLPDEVPRTYYGGAWSADSGSFFYTVHDTAYRPFQVWRHVLGTPVADDVLVVDEPDERFEVNLRATRSGRLVVIWAESRDTSEVWVVDARHPAAPARSVGGRRPGVEYHAEHVLGPDREDWLLVVTNDDAVEFRLVRAPVPGTADQDHTTWRPVLPENPDERLERVDAFAGHVVLSLRTGGEHRLRLLPLASVEPPLLQDVEPPLLQVVEVRPVLPGGTVTLGPNAEFAATEVVVADQSYLHPAVWSAVDLDTGARTEVHRQVAPGHDPARYTCEVRSFPAPDGTSVPATVVRRRDTPLDGTAPALVYGYGAYEYTFEPEWDPALPCLLDRGVVFVHAHVRGGGEGGRRWWLDGRLDRKQNTFTDHLAVADGLATQGLVDGSRIATRGLSAGGLLQGAVLSQRPER